MLLAKKKQSTKISKERGGTTPPSHNTGGSQGVTFEKPVILEGLCQNRHNNKMWGKYNNSRVAIPFQHAISANGKKPNKTHKNTVYSDVINIIANFIKLELVRQITPGLISTKPKKILG